MRLRLPEIGYGTQKLRYDETTDCVLKALEIGYRLIDAFKNEREVMAAIRIFLEAHPEIDRNEIIVTTKLCGDFFGSDRAYEGIKELLERSGGFIDVVVMQDPGASIKERRETWSALEEFVHRGEIRYIGVSNYSIAHLKEMDDYAEIMPAVNQIEVNPWKQMNELVEYCRENEIAVQGYSPLVLGAAYDKPNLNDVAVAHGATQAQVLLRYLIDREITPLPRARSFEHMIENFRSLDIELLPLEVHHLGNPNDYFMAIPGWDPLTWI